MSAWGGVSGLGFGLSLLYTELGKKLGLARIVDLLGEKQAKQVGLEKQKGSLKEGFDADFVIFDPTEKRTVSLVSSVYPPMEKDVLTHRPTCNSKIKSRRISGKSSRVGSSRHTWVGNSYGTARIPQTTGWASCSDPSA